VAATPEGVVKPFDDSHPLELAAVGLDDFHFLTFAPKGERVTLLGELNKWISVSSQRFGSYLPAEGKVRINGVAGELVEVSWQLTDGSVGVCHCVLPESGSMWAGVRGEEASCWEDVPAIMF